MDAKPSQLKLWKLAALLAAVVLFTLPILRGLTNSPQEAAKAASPNNLYLPFIVQFSAGNVQVLANDIQVPGFTGNEPHAAVVNPRNPANVVLSQVNSLRISNDFGATFPIAVNSAAFPNNYGTSGDDVLAFDAAGRLWWVYLMSFDGDGGGVNNLATDDLTVVVQQVNPVTGALVGNAIDIAPGNHSDDKPWIAADSNVASPFANNVYVHWTRFDNNPTESFFSRCVNCAATNVFSAPANIATGGGEGFRHQTNVAVGANGNVYVSYHTNTCGNNEADGDIILMRDANGGADLAAGGNPPANVFKTSVFGAGGAEVTCNRQPNPPTVPRARFLMQGSSAPFVVADPVRPGNLYVIASDDPNNAAGSGDDGDVVMARSTNFGQSFTVARIDHAPQGASSLQVFPQGAIDQDGNLSVFWYDTRRQVNNNGPDGIAGNADDYWNLDVYATASLDGGVTFSNDFRINDTPFDPQLNAPNFRGDNPNTFRIGEYNGIAAANSIAYVTWTGNAPGGGNQRIFFDLFSILGAFPDRFEPNEAINFAVNASLGSDDTYSERRLSIHSATDVDFFKVTALHTGKLEASIAYNERVNNLAVRVRDQYNNILQTGTISTQPTGSSQDTLTIPVVEGENYYVEVFDANGPNAFAAQSTYDLSIVNRAVPAPFGLDLQAANDSGLSDQDNVTNQPGGSLLLRVNTDALSNLSFSPNNDLNLADDLPGYKVRVYRNGSIVGYATPVIGQPGMFQFSLSGAPLSEGPNFITAKVVIVDVSDDPNSFGTVHQVRPGAESEALGITLDTLAPAAPSTPDLLASSDSGVSNSDNVTNVNPPAFQGTAEANAIIRILANGEMVGKEMVGTDFSDGIPANGLGAWEVTVEPLGDGTYTITATAEDLAGNISPASAPLAPNLVIDTGASGTPQRPTIDLVDSFDTGRSNLDNVTALTQLNFRVTADPGTSVVIKDGNTVIDSFLMPVSGETVRTLVLANGPHPLSTESTDLAGNTSHQSHELLVTVDTLPPAAGVPDLAVSSDSAGVNDDNLTTLLSPAFIGSEEANALVKVFANGVKVGSGLVGSDDTDGLAGNGLGLYEVTVEPLSDAVYNITITLEDLAGNASPASNALQVTIANQVLNLSGAGVPIVVTLDNLRVSGFPGYPSAGSVVGIAGIPVVNLDANGQDLVILGTPLGDDFTYTPTGAQSGSFTRQGSTQVINFSAAGGTLTIDPAAGTDTLSVNGTASIDEVNALVDLAVTSVQVNALKMVNLPIANVELLSIYALDGEDTINVMIYDTVNAHLYVDAGNPEATNPVSDALNVIASSPKGMLQKQPGGPVPGSGSIFVSYPLTTLNESRIDYAYTEKITLIK